MIHDPLLETLPPCVGNYIQQKAKAICRENGHFCPYWIHEDILVDLAKFDREDKGNRAERYMNQCHELEVVIKPPEAGSSDQSWFLGFKCHELMGFSKKNCNFTCKIAEDIMLEQTLKMYKEIPKET